MGLASAVLLAPAGAAEDEIVAACSRDSAIDFMDMISFCTVPSTETRRSSKHSIARANSCKSQTWTTHSFSTLLHEMSFYQHNLLTLAISAARS